MASETTRGGHVARIDAAITAIRGHGLTGDAATLLIYVAHRDGTARGCFADIERMCADLGWAASRVKRARSALIASAAVTYERAGRSPSVLRFAGSTGEPTNDAPPARQVSRQTEVASSTGELTNDAPPGFAGSTGEPDAGSTGEPTKQEANQKAQPAREGGGSAGDVEGGDSATFGRASDAPTASRAVSSDDHIAAWCAHELGVGEAAVTAALTACPRPDAFNVAARLGADITGGRVKVERSVGGLLRHRLREDPRGDPTPPPPWPPGEDTPERRRRWADERWEARARRQEAETRRRLREED